jgi:hypothetical protein
MWNAEFDSVPFAFANFSEIRDSIVICVVNAFVDATPISGPACVYAPACVSLAIEEPTTLHIPKVKPLLREEGIAVIEKEGTWITSDFGELETPLIDNAECVYAIFDEKNTALCAIEEAHNRGIVDWKKPISCHLYPVRVKEYTEFAAVNYNKWDICDDACSLGKELQVPVYKFVKEALVRKFGQAWYTELEKIAEKHK